MKNRNHKHIGRILGMVFLGLCATEAGAIINQPVYLSASGNNANDGLSPATAWESVNALDSEAFGPGAQILFNRGDSFSGACTLVGSGSVNDPIVVGAYGTGDKPLLTGVWNKQQIFLLSSGNEYIEFHDLQLSNFNTSNTSIKERYGISIAVPAGAGDVRHLYFQDLDFFDIQGSGQAVHEDDHRSIGIIAATVDNDTAPTRFNDVLIEGCTFTDIDGLGAQLRDYSQDIADFKIDGTAYYPTIGFVFQDNYGTNLYRNLLMTRGTKDALVQYNTMDTTVEGSAFWPFACDGTLVQFNLFKNLRAPDADAYVCHFDYNCIDLIMQYNIGINVEGGLIEYIVNSTWNGFQENGIARYNIGIDVGYREDLDNPGTSKPNSAGIFLTGRVEGGQFYNNTIIQLSQPLYQAISFNDWGGAWPTNNVIYNNIFYAADTVSTYNSPLRMLEKNNVVSHNLYYGNIVSPEVWDGTPVDQNPFAGNPAFANPAGLAAEDFKVFFGSAAISNGLLIAGNGGRDYFDYAVSSNNLPTLGFHEYQSDPVIDSDGDAMVDQWEAGFGLDPGDPDDAAEDPDFDLLKNLAEFAVGGDPANGGDVGHVPTFESADVGGGTNGFAYVYPRRTDWQEIGLDYGLGFSTNLMDGSWVDGAHWISGVGAEEFGEGFDAVTNYLSFGSAVGQGFVRLEIQ
jgi:hypothetical protein